MRDEFVDQKRENDEFEAGVQSEEQNAFQHSKMTTEIKNDSAEIERLRKEGFYVLVAEADITCRSTDAFLGRSKVIVQSSKDVADLNAILGRTDQCRELYILDPIAPEPPKHKHYFAPGYQTCQCGALRCSHRACDKVATSSGMCRKHSKAATQAVEQGFWSVTRINEILSNPCATTVLENGKTVSNKLIIYRFLQRMYERQTASEQQTMVTNTENGIGFNKADSVLMTSFAQNTAEYYRTHPHCAAYALTDRQAIKMAGKLRKYVKGQLVDIANESTQEMPETKMVPNFIANRNPLTNVDAQKASHIAQYGEPTTPAFTSVRTEPVVAAATPDVTRMVELKRVHDPENFFMDGEMSLEVAIAFWTKRYLQHPMTAHEVAELEGK